jgi:hypothetical protein
MHSIKTNSNEYCLFCNFNKINDQIFLKKSDRIFTNKVFSFKYIILLDTLHLKINFVKYFIIGLKETILIKFDSNKEEKTKSINEIFKLFNININLNKKKNNYIGQSFEAITNESLKLICEILNVDQNPITSCFDYLNKLSFEKSLIFDKNIFLKIKEILNLKDFEYLHLLLHFNDLNQVYDLKDGNQKVIEHFNKRIKFNLKYHSNFRRDIPLNYLKKLLLDFWITFEFN